MYVNIDSMWDFWIKVENRPKCNKKMKIMYFKVKKKRFMNSAPPPLNKGAKLDPKFQNKVSLRLPSLSS